VEQTGRTPPAIPHAPGGIPETDKERKRYGGAYSAAIQPWCRRIGRWGAVSDGHPKRGIVCHAIEIVLIGKPHGHGVDPLAQQLDEGVPNTAWSAWIRHSYPDGLDYAQAMIDIPKQENSTVGTETLIVEGNLDRTVEPGLPGATLACTHRVTSCVGMAWNEIPTKCRETRDRPLLSRNVLVNNPKLGILG
jgi:hypothetical protein